MNLNAKNLFYFMCSFLVLGGIGVGYSLYWANAQLVARGDMINALNLEADDLDSQIINASRLTTQLSENEELRLIANEVLPRSKTQENIVAELLAIANSNGVALEGINFVGGNTNQANSPVSQADKVDGVAGVYSIAVSTGFETTYEKLLTILEDLETNRRHFEVTDIDITPIKDESGNVSAYSTQLTVLTYVRPE